jgi:cell division protein FtsI (penicillin-binding protein 3)
MNIQNRKNRYRVLCLTLFIFVLFVILVAQFYRIQIVEGEKWSKVARRQHFFVVKEPFLRGRFFSNTSIKKGHPETPQSFVVDVQKFHLCIDPESVPDDQKDPISKKLMSLVELSVSEKLAFRYQFDKKSRCRRLAMWLDSETRDAVMAWWGPYSRQHRIVRNALFFVKDYQRSYPFGKLLGPVLHTIQKQKDEKTKQAIPTGGLELYFNKYLQGTEGKRRLMRSPRNSLETGEVISEPKNGADIYLTINHFLQAIVEEELEKGAKKCKAKFGWAVMMDPYTGEILALAQYPFFNLPEYELYFNKPEMIEHTRIKPVVDSNEPGSVMKPFTLMIALMANKELEKRGEKPLFSMDEKIATSNGRFPGRSKPIKDTHLHYYLNMKMGLQKSSNIYMGRLIERVIARLGSEWYRNALSEVFGFGKLTGIELPAESPGLLPTPGKKHPNGTFEWSTPTPFSLAMGYNLQLNVIQLLRAYSILATGGYMANPTIVRKIVRTNNDGSEEIILDNTKPGARPAPKLALDPEIVKTIATVMQYTTKVGGTAPKGNVWGYTDAGKTSTSKKLIGGVYAEKTYRSSFVGFTPVGKPAFLLLIGMDEPCFECHSGGNASAPVFRDIASRALAYLGIPKDDPHGYPKSDPRHDGEKAHWLPESRKLQEMYESWNNGKGKH